MANIGKLFPSKHLSAADLDGDMDVTIISEGETEVMNEGVKQMKHCLYFQEFDKPFILNPTNAKTIAQILKSNETEEWIGGRITIYPATVDAFGKQVEAIRVKLRAPRPAQSRQPQPQSVAASVGNVRQPVSSQRHSEPPDDPFGDDPVPF